MIIEKDGLKEILEAFDTERFINFIIKNKHRCEKEVYEIIMGIKDSKLMLLKLMSTMMLQRNDISKEKKKEAMEIIKDINNSIIIYERRGRINESNSDSRY